VSAAGHTPSIPRQPANAATTQNGTSTEKNGNWRPTIFDSAKTSMPVTWLSVVIGMPNEPNATGAVFAINARHDACKGRNPSWIRIAPVIATGAPNPAMPSMNAPKEKAMRITCTRGSGAR
jgi:hypothetical protein